jgi:hypothetical protein
MTTLATATNLADIARVLRNAAAVGPAQWKGDAMAKRRSAASADLGDDLVELFRLLQTRKIPYVLVGGVALLKYIDGRNTEDIDLVISLASLKKIPEIVIHDRNPFFARGRFKSVDVDLLLTRNPLFRLVQRRHATQHNFGGVSVRCATVEGLALLKLYALPSLYRRRDMQRIALYETDLAMLCQRHRPAINPLLDALAPFLTDGELEDVRGIAAEIEKRIARMEGRGFPS